jgi:hypothetical protein
MGKPNLTTCPKNRKYYNILASQRNTILALTVPKKRSGHYGYCASSGLL